jgi:serine/threonine protein kinase
VTVVQLKRTWELGEQIGGGGFGQVFRASNGGEFAALKLVPKDAGAERETLFVDLDSAENVVPILDSGGTDEAWVIVAKRRSLYATRRKR